MWRSNLLGSSGKGHEYFLKHLLGTAHGVMGRDLGETGGKKPREVAWRDPAPEGKLDLLVTLDFRMSTTCLYSDVVLPTATWYEKNDLNTTDMHPFIHPLTAAVDPVWECKSDWEIYKAIARKFSEVAPEVLGVEQDVVLAPILHDTPGELAQPFGVEDWKAGGAEPVPGRTMPSVVTVERDYPGLYERFTALGPLLERAGNGGKGISWDTGGEVRALRRLNGEAARDGPARGLARIESDVDAAEVILMLAPETNGEVAVKAWEALGANTGLDHTHLAAPRKDEKVRFRDVVAQPRKIISSPTWSGLESEHVCYNAGYTNVHERIPWRTLTGRQQIYQDHPWMRAFRGVASRVPPSHRHQDHRAGHGGGRRRPAFAGPELHHPPPEMGNPFHVLRQPPHADVESGRARGLALGDGRGAGRHRGQRLGGGVQRERRAHRPRGRLAADPGGDPLHVPRAGEDREHPGLGGDRPAGRDPQLGDPGRSPSRPT